MCHIGTRVLCTLLVPEQRWAFRSPQTHLTANLSATLQDRSKTDTTCTPRPATLLLHRKLQHRRRVFFLVYHRLLTKRAVFARQLIETSTGQEDVGVPLDSAETNPTRRMAHFSVVENDCPNAVHLCGSLGMLKVVKGREIGAVRLYCFVCGWWLGCGSHMIVVVRDGGSRR